jgi:hypothetical protein
MFPFTPHTTLRPNFGLGGFLIAVASTEPGLSWVAIQSKGIFLKSKTSVFTMVKFTRNIETVKPRISRHVISRKRYRRYFSTRST